MIGTAWAQGGGAAPPALVSFLPLLLVFVVFYVLLIRPQQQKAKEFMSLLPLTLAIAGLPECEAGRHYTETQLEARATTIRAAL